MAIELDGADNLARTLTKAARELDDLTTPHDQVDHAVAALARARAPRLSGTLAASTGPGIAASSFGEVIATAGHAIPVHFGTKHMRARPYIADAIDTLTDVTILPTFAAYADDVLSHVKGT